MKPFHIRKISDDIIITDEILTIEYQNGEAYANKKIDAFNEYLDPHRDYCFSWGSQRMNEREIHYFLSIEHR